MAQIASRNLGIVQGVKAVTTGGTAEVISATAILTKSVIIQAKRAGGNNTGSVFIGDETLDAGVAEGIELKPGNTISFEAADPKTGLDLNQIYVDADTSEDGVVFVYIPLRP